MRGLPGSGKTRLAKQWHQQYASRFRAEDIICSIDDYFQRGTRYTFEADKLPVYQALCLVRFINGLKARRPIMICDNTNMQCWEYLPYQAAAEALGYDVRRVLVGDPSDQGQIQQCTSSNRHGLSKSIIVGYSDVFERDEDKPYSPWA
nr:AAA family ATPase [Echinimonas agarilytica]